MSKWSDRLKREISRNADQGTANTADRNLTSVTAVARPAKSEILRPVEREHENCGTVSNEVPPRAWVIQEIRDEAGETIAVKICSAPLEAHLWILNDPDFIPPDDDPIFFADEFEYLETKSIEELRGALKATIAFRDRGWCNE